MFEGGPLCVPLPRKRTGLHDTSSQVRHRLGDMRRVQGLKHMAQEDGFRGMMKGNGTNCVRIIPNQAVKFLTYEQLNR